MLGLKRICRTMDELRQRRGVFKAELQNAPSTPHHSAAFYAAREWNGAAPFFFSFSSFSVRFFWASRSDIDVFITVHSAEACTHMAWDYRLTNLSCCHTEWSTWRLELRECSAFLPAGRPTARPPNRLSMQL